MIKDYLKSRLKVIILLMTAVLIFASSYLLFDMPVVTVLYPVILCIAFLLLIGIIDFLITLGKHKQLQMREMPAPSGILEKDYQKIIFKLKEEEELSRKKANEDFNNMVEYYTVWAHQIKTPIASMRLQLQSEDTDVARRLNGDLNRIEEYVGMVLTFLRLDSDSTDYVIKEIDLDKVIKPVIRKFARDFISKKLSMDYETLETKVLSDEKWLSFVIEQVISNAVKYTKTGGIRIYMKEAGILCIEDTGIGISAEDLPEEISRNGTGQTRKTEALQLHCLRFFACKRKMLPLLITGR